MRLSLATMLVALGSPALADAVLPINGVFGNEAGCAFFMDGQIVTDEFMTLTPDTFTSYGTACAFDALLRREGEVFTVSATCRSEGEPGSTRDTVRIIDRGVEGFWIQFEGLEEWGPMLPCPGTAELFEPMGVPV